MRPFLHLVSIGLLLPSLFFAAMFVILGRVIAGATLWQVVDRIFLDALWLMTWGALVVAVFFIAVSAGGFFIQTRWLAATCIALLSAASALILIFFDARHMTFGQWLFLVPGFVSLAISSWLAQAEWP